MRTFPAALVTALAAGLTLSAAPVPKEKTTAEKLVGTWKLTNNSKEGPPEGVDFHVILTAIKGETGKGEMTIKIIPKEKDGEAAELKGTYKLLPADKDHKEDRIDYTVDEPGGGKKTEILTIKKLTDDELVTTDPDDIKEEFKRVKAKD